MSLDINNLLPLYQWSGHVGPCLVCRHLTEEKDGDEFLHQSCAEQLRRDQAEDHRLDDPRHGQAKNINRKGDF